MENIEYILDFCKELGKQMIVCGANIERVDMSIEHICHGYGLHDVTCANLTTRIAISAKDENKNYSSRQTDVPPQSFNLERLKKLNRLSYFVRENKPDPTTLRDLLDDVKSNDFSWWVILLGYTVAMAALSRIFQAGPFEMLLAIVNTWILFGLSKLFSKIKLNKIITNFVSMFIVSAVSILAYKAGIINNFFIVMITNAFYLIPGIQMINCARNLLCGNEQNGVIELLKILLEICTIVAGLAAAYALLSGLVGQPTLEDNIVAAGTSVPAYIELIVLTLLASAGFSVVFNIQLKDIPLAAVGGAIVRIVHILGQLAFPEFKFLYTLLAAFAAALYSEILAINRKEPSTLFLYPSIVPLIPGDLFYYVALGLVWNNEGLLQYGPDLLLVLISISVGFVICSSVVHYIRKFKFNKILNQNK